MIKQLFNTIAKQCNDNSDRGQTDFYYKLPRGVGTSTYLQEAAADLSRQGFTVIFITPNRPQLEYGKSLGSNTKVLTNTQNILGLKCDVILIDRPSQIKGLYNIRERLKARWVIGIDTDD